MKKHNTYKYSLLLLISLFGLIFWKYNIFTRNHNLPKNSPIEFEYFLREHKSNCLYQTSPGYRFYWPNCTSAVIGEYYTIIGTLKPATDTDQTQPINIEISSITKSQTQKSSVFIFIVTLYRFFLDLTQKLRLLIVSAISSHLRDTNSSLLLGLTLGSSFAGFSPGFKALIKNLGLSHMVAVSGFHLGLCYLLFSSFFAKFLQPKFSQFVTIICLIWYANLVGNPLSVLRALFMLILSLIGHYFLHKQTNSLYGLFLSFLLLSNLSVLNVFNVGFQLSYLATLGILLFGGLDVASLRQPPLSFSPSLLKKQWLEFLSFIKASILTSLAAQLMSLPVLIVTFGELSPWGILSSLVFSSVISLLVSLAIPLIIFFLLFAKFNFICRILILPFFLFLDDLTSLLVSALRRYELYFGGLVTFDQRLSWWQICLYYGLIFVFIWFWRRLHRVKFNYV